ncbi:hypothetical protein AB1Y20_004833 [Prymnesium parvum]|uniref:PPM-type phosphatase domain-containing protein n=1 Tax=Prymnesium parvum TaxID=97485 RepID=A0AB34IZF3_PRYPA
MPAEDSRATAPLDVQEVPRVTFGQHELVCKGEDRMDARQVVIAGEAVYLALIADGHGGEEAADLCKKCLFDYFLDAAESADAQILRRAARSSFERLHEDVLALSPPTTSGSTLTLCVLNPTRREITCAHVGDSVAILVPAVNKALPMELCEDHRIDSSEHERTRLKTMGGHIAHAKDSRGQPGGPLRLWPGGVAQARTIGDSDIGEYNDPRPHTATFPFPTFCDCFDIVVASDGVWDALLRSRVATICRKTGDCTAGATARLIVNASLQQRHAYDNQDMQVPKDDTSCIVLRVGDFDMVRSVRRKSSCFGC